MKPGRPFKTGPPARDHDREHPTIRDGNGPEEYPALVEIWRSAVLATHDFLAEQDFQRIESSLARDYLPAVRLRVATIAGTPAGFSGLSDEGIEMLFVDDAQRGRGIGSALLRDAIERGGAAAVDVNEQNDGARGFYLARGFEIVGRSPFDGDGRPYPILHLRLSPTRENGQNNAGGASGASDIRSAS